MQRIMKHLLSSWIEVFQALPYFFLLVYKTSGPITIDLSRTYEGLKEVYEYFQDQIKLFTDYWNRLTISDIMENGPDEKYLTYSLVDSSGQVEKEEIGHQQNTYDLLYYRYLQFTNKQNELEQLEAKIKAQPPFMTIKGGGVKRCKLHVPLVNRSRGFPFLGEMDSKHPHFEFYKVAYHLLYGPDEVRQYMNPNREKEEREAHEKAEAEAEKERAVPAQFLLELPFHKLNFKNTKSNSDTIQDRDDNQKEIIPKDPFYKYYKQVAQAQAEQKKELLAKRQRKEVPIIVRKAKKNPKLYWELSQERDILRKIPQVDPDYDFAVKSEAELLATNEQLRELRAALEHGKVHIEAIVNNLAKTPIFMINHNPEYWFPRSKI